LAKAIPANYNGIPGKKNMGSIEKKGFLANSEAEAVPEK